MNIALQDHELSDKDMALLFEIASDSNRMPGHLRRAPQKLPIFQSGNRTCVGCGEVIPEGRLEALPDTTQCTACASKGPRVVQFDPNVVCAKSSGSARNGFAAND